MPSSPSTYILSSPASINSPLQSPINHTYPGNYYSSPSNYPSPIHDFGPPVPSTSNLQPSKENVKSSQSSMSSSWKKGMRKLFKSKSQAALRQSPKHSDQPLPPLPTGRNNYVSHTPPTGDRRAPLGELKRNNIMSFFAQSTQGGNERGFTHPSLPPDPFESHLDIAADPSALRPPSPLRPKLRSNSPSLRDLKNMLSLPSRPKIAKAKSLANLRSTSTKKINPELEEMPVRRIEKTDTVRGLVQRPDVERKEDLRSSPQEPPRHPRIALPAPSPPLLPPNPPYMTRSTSCGPTESGTPPDVPLPPAPIATPLSDSSSSTSPIKRSGSTPMLLPRSRSTSMSLKSPPTSSSFFDLYEQLGIWPKGETEEKKDDGILDKSEESVKSSPEDTLADGTVKQCSSKASPAADLIPTKTMSLSSPFMGASSSAWGPVLGHVSEGPSSPASAHGPPSVDAPPSGADAKSDQQQQQQQTSLPNLIGPSEEVVDSAEEITPNVKPSSSRSSDSYPAALEISTFTFDPRLSSDTQPTSVAMSIKNSRASRRFDISSDGSSRDEVRENPDMGGIEKVDNDEDDLPLSRTHPNAAAAQQQRRDVRQTPERSQTLSKVKVRGRNPGGDTDWDGEGGVPADVLTTKLEKALVMMEKIDLMRSVSHRHVSQADGKPVLPLQIHRRSTWSESLAARELSPVDAVSKRPESPLPPIPKPPMKLLSAIVVSEKSTKQIAFELQPKTTARDVLVDACKNGDLKETKNGMSWVLCEVFAEMGCGKSLSR